jgi:predicted transcriptional regulator
MEMMRRLPDAELEIMKAVWRNTPPVTSLQITKVLESEKKWKPQTILTMLARLIEKGYLESEKVGKTRKYTPIISEAMYLKSETGSFMQRYHENSLGSFVKTLYDGKELSEEDLQELKDFLSERM